MLDVKNSLMSIVFSSLIVLTPIKVQAQPFNFDAAKSFKYSCGRIVDSKRYSTDMLLIIIGEYHTFSDVQKDVYCLLDEILLKEGVSFLGLEGKVYDPTKFQDGTWIIPTTKGLVKKVIKEFGIENKSYRDNYSVIEEIDDKHKRLAKKKMETGLNSLESAEYADITYQSYKIILEGRSNDWGDNLKDFFGKWWDKFSVGVINLGFGHFPTFKRKLEQMGISYVLIVPNSIDNYCPCEAYFTKKKPSNDMACREVCENNQIPARWD